MTGTLIESGSLAGVDAHGPAVPGRGGPPTAPRSGEPLTRHDGPVRAVAAGALADGTPVIISGDGRFGEGTVRVWRLADGTALRQSEHLPYGRQATW